jgi:hypothetical protein
VAPSELRPIDLIVAGSVAVNRQGGRVGKGAATPTWSTRWAESSG